jgi:phospholipase C
LPKSGGVFFVKGGYQNTFGLEPADPDPKVQKNFLGDDDTPPIPTRRSARRSSPKR